MTVPHFTPTAGLVRFVILAVPRSGSNMLSSLLNSHPDVLCHHELYNPGGIYYALELRGTGFSLAADIRARDRRPLEFLDRVWRHPLSRSCVGFKMTHRQNPEVFDAVLADPCILKIVLRRDNAVKTHVSRLVAEHTHIWEDYGQSADRPPAAIQLSLDLDALRRDMDFNQTFYDDIDARLKQSAQGAFHIEYEQLADRSVHHAMLAYLGLDYHPLTTSSRKQNPTDLRLRVSNFMQVLAQCQDASLKAQLIDFDS